MKIGFKKFIFVVSVALLGACGRGSIQVDQHINSNGKISAKSVVKSLLNSPLNTPSADSQNILLRLKSAPPENFDWQEFWDELSVGGKGQVLIERQRGLLLDLHSKDCSVYPAFVSFAIANFDATHKMFSPSAVPFITKDYILGKKRECTTKLPVRVATQYFSKMVKAYEKIDHDQRTEMLGELFQFLTNEYDGSPTWAVAIREQEPKLIELGNNLIVEKKWLPHYRFSRFARKVLNNDNLMSSFIQQAFKNQQVTQELLMEQTFNEVFEEAHQVILKLHESKIRPEIGLPLAEHLKNTTKDPDFIFNGVRALYLVRLVSSNQSATAQLNSYNTILRVLERELLKKQKNIKEQFVSSHARILGNAWEKDFLFLSMRLDFVFEGVDKYFQQASKENTIDEVLDYWVKMQFNEDAMKKMNLTKQYCDLLEQKGIRFNHVHLNSIYNGTTPSGLGCIYVETAIRNPKDKIEQVDLDLPFSSVLILKNTDLKIPRPISSLGTVVLNTTTELNEPVQKTTPTPPSFSAMVIPLLVGISIEMPTARFKSGTHFFVIHHVVRVARPGEKELVQAQKGLSGPSFIISNSNPMPRFNFVSMGGPGQRGAAPRPGGQGDVSYLESSRVLEWLDAVSSTSKLEVAKPWVVQEFLNYSEIEELMQNAVKNAAQKIQIMVLPNYTSILSKEVRTKITETCEIELKDKLFGKSLAREDVDFCLKEYLVPKAINSLQKVIENSKTDATIIRTAAVPELTMNVEFKVSPGAVGPENPSGVFGDSGQIIKAGSK